MPKEFVHIFLANKTPIGVANKIASKARLMKAKSGARTIILSRVPPVRNDALGKIADEWRTFEGSFFKALAQLASEIKGAPFYLRMPEICKELAQLVKTYPKRFVFEHNTIHWKERFCCFRDLTWRDHAYILRTKPSRFWTDYLRQPFNEKLFLSDILKNSLASVTVCESIRAHLKFYRLEHRVLVLGNGIELSTTPVREGSPGLETELGLLFVSGCSASWTGEDRLFEGLKRYDGSLPMRLECVGDFRKESKSFSALPRNVHVNFHGLQDPAYISRIASTCHLGIATLGLHRKGLYDASVLKVRTYIALGLPFLLGYEDVDVPFDYPYCIRFSADESPIELEKTIPFVKGLLENGFTPQKMRKQARSLVCLERKVDTLCDFIGKCADEEGSAGRR